MAQLKNAFESQKEAAVVRDPGVNIAELNLSKDLAEAENCLELLLIAMSRAFVIQPKQAAGLITDGSKYLAGILVKGIMNEFAPVELFLTDFYSASGHFTALIQREEPGTIEMVLNMLKPGLYSKGKGVAKQSMAVVAELAGKLASGELQSNLWNWFSGEEGGLAGVAYALKRHSGVESVAIEMLLSFGRAFEVFTQLLKFAVNDDLRYWKIVNSFIEPFSTLDSVDKKSFNLILTSWLESATRISENESKYTVIDRSTALSIICEIWINSPSTVEEKEDAAEKVLTILRRATRDNSQAFQLFALAQSFRLLEVLALRKNNCAPLLYKSLALSFVELHEQEEVREFVLNNFKKLFSAMQSMPISIMMDIVIKQLETSSEQSYPFNCFDLEFLRRVVTHPKLDLRTGVQLLDIFAKHILNSSIFSMILLRYFRIICNRMRQETSVVQLLGKCAKVIFNAMPAGFKRYFLLKDKEKSLREAKREEMKLLDFNLKKFVKVLLIIQSIKNEHMNEQMREIVLHMHLNNLKEFRKAYEPLKVLLKMYGDPDELIASEIERVNTEEQRKAEELQAIAIEEVGNEKALVPVEEVVQKESRVVPYQKRVDVGRKAKTQIEQIKKTREERDAKVTFYSKA